MQHLSPENDKNLFNLITIIVAEFFHNIVNGLYYLHSQNPAIIHRDLNPCNILIKLLNSDISIKICDFGLSTCNNENDMHTTGIGNTWFMAPEVRNSDNYNEKCDLFSLGIILKDLMSVLDIYRT